MKPLDLDGEAEAEYRAATRYYEKEQTGLGREFVIEVKRTFEEIQVRPQSGHRYGRKGFRFMLTDRFPYVIYYEELEDRIWVAAVAHGSRKLGYWHKRKRKE